MAPTVMGSRWCFRPRESRVSSRELLLREETWRRETVRMPVGFIYGAVSVSPGKEAPGKGGKPSCGFAGSWDEWICQAVSRGPCLRGHCPLTGLGAGRCEECGEQGCGSPGRREEPVGLGSAELPPWEGPGEGGAAGGVKVPVGRAEEALSGSPW